MQNAARLRSVTQVSGSFCQWKFFSHPGAAVPRSRYPCYPLLLLKGNCRVKQKRQWTVCLPVDIPMGWEPRRNLAVRALRVAFADFSTTPWQGFEKSERGPNNSSLFQPQAAVVVVALWLCLRHKCRRLVRDPLPRTKRKTSTQCVLVFGAVKQSKSEPFSFDAAWAASSNVMVCVPSL